MSSSSWSSTSRFDKCNAFACSCASMDSCCSKLSCLNKNVDKSLVVRQFLDFNLTGPVFATKIIPFPTCVEINGMPETRNRLDNSLTPKDVELFLKKFLGIRLQEGVAPFFVEVVRNGPNFVGERTFDSRSSRSRTHHSHKHHSHRRAGVSKTKSDNLSGNVVVVPDQNVQSVAEVVQDDVNVVENEPIVEINAAIEDKSTDFDKKEKSKSKSKSSHCSKSTHKSKRSHESHSTKEKI